MSKRRRYSEEFKRGAVEQTLRLDELLSANAPLHTVYVLKTQLKELWYAPDPTEAQRRWQEWYTMAIDSGLTPLIAFARRLQPYLRHHRQRPTSTQHQRARGHEQPDQDHQAHGLRLPRHRILLLENPRRLFG